jgi:sulfite reductase beta subunit-like hemoprotein
MKESPFINRILAVLNVEAVAIVIVALLASQKSYSYRRRKKQGRPNYLLA